MWTPRTSSRGDLAGGLVADEGRDERTDGQMRLYPGGLVDVLGVHGRRYGF